jgi:hypothetical protein
MGCPVAFSVGQANYDLVIEDTGSGYGGKTCKDTKDAAYYSFSVDASSCSVIASAAQTAGCCGAVCDLCGVGSYVPMSRYYTDSVVLDTVVDGISLPGYDDVVTCRNLAYAAYRKGTFDVESCPASGDAAKQAGCFVPYVCLTCDVGSFIPSTEAVNDACDNLRPAVLTNLRVCKVQIE